MKTEVHAKVVADSIFRQNRLTTIQVTGHRFVLAEFNTHRALSRNSNSSRAIPVARQLKRVQIDPAYPLSWPAEQPGMQGGEEVSIATQSMALREWYSAAEDAIGHAERLAELGIHKSVTNRLLEPFMWHTIVVSATEWTNFFKQRSTVFSPLAQPEIRAIADVMYVALAGSEPKPMGAGEWHLPYVTEDERHTYMDYDLIRIAVARCARISRVDDPNEQNDVVKDFARYEMLVSATPMHASPLEHIATPCTNPMHHHGNFTGWHQHRDIVEKERAASMRFHNQ